MRVVLDHGFDGRNALCVCEEVCRTCKERRGESDGVSVVVLVAAGAENPKRRSMALSNSPTDFANFLYAAFLK